MFYTIINDICFVDEGLCQVMIYLSNTGVELHNMPIRLARFFKSPQLVEDISQVDIHPRDSWIKANCLLISLDGLCITSKTSECQSLPMECPCIGTVKLYSPLTGFKSQLILFGFVICNAFA